MPLTLNGKIDGRNLPEPETALDKEYVAPSNEIEKKLIEIWVDLLKVEKNMIGIYDNFFECRGNPIIIMAFHSKLCAKLKLEDVPVVALFHCPSIRMFSYYLSNREVEFMIPDDIY